VTYAQSDTQIRARCHRFLSYHHPRTSREWLRDLADAPVPSDEPDFYGTGACIRALEADFAGLLGKESAVFMPSGTMAQQAALRVWADTSGRRTVAIHPQAHIHRDERSAYERLHGLRGIPLTHEPRYPNADDLTAVREPVGTLLIELPLRRLTYALPDWNELTALAQTARAAGTRVHLDGARLWECSPYYERSPAAIASLADSVCVSVYKGLGGLSGAVLAGPEALIAGARLWQHRHGGQLHSLFPLVFAAYAGLQRHLPRVAEYAATARGLAQALSDVPGLTAIPKVPCINAFQLHFHNVTPAALQRLHARQADATGTWLFNWFQESVIPDAAFADVVIGDALDRWSIDGAAQAIRALAAGVTGA